jgi:hypothetical protein
LLFASGHEKVSVTGGLNVTPSGSRSTTVTRFLEVVPAPYPLLTPVVMENGVGPDTAPGGTLMETRPFGVVRLPPVWSITAMV